MQKTKGIDQLKKRRNIYLQSLKIKANIFPQSDKRWILKLQFGKGRFWENDQPFNFDSDKII